VSYNRLGALMRALGNGEQAKDFFKRNLAIADGLARAEPHRADYQRDLSVSYERLGELMQDLERGEEAKGYFEKALAIRERLAHAEPDRSDYQRDLVMSLMQVAGADPANSEDLLQRALTRLLALRAKASQVEQLDEMIARLQQLLSSR